MNFYRIAVMDQLGRQFEAKEAATELLSLVPDFEKHGSSFIHRLVFLDEYVDMLFECFERAG